MNRLTILYAHMTPARWLQTAVVVTALFAVVLAVFIRTSASSPASVRRIIGLPAPAFSLQAESHGQVLPGTISLASERGHAVLLVFMYSLCPHCLNQIETVKSLETQRATGGAVRVVYIDSPAESAGIISAYAERLGIESPSNPILLDPSGLLARKYGIVYYPAIILIDTQGFVRQVWTGEATSDSLSSAIKRLAQGDLAPAPANGRRTL